MTSCIRHVTTGFVLLRKKERLFNFFLKTLKGSLKTSNVTNLLFSKSGIFQKSGMFGCIAEVPKLWLKNIPKNKSKKFKKINLFFFFFL